MESNAETFTHEKLPDEPIITLVLGAGFRFNEDLPLMVDEAITLFEEAGTPCYYIAIVDETRWPLDELVKAANIASRGTRAFLHHPLLKEFVVVTRSKVIELMVAGLRHDTFGNVNIRATQTLEEALAYARSPDGDA